ncbi:hypothetical protein KY285_035579 [Solanum tuberosum]|nr:hypothetical protein KY285_035579 [Solanum tuberosum]
MGQQLARCNIDGASRGNPGPSSSAFCTRDHFGNLVVAKGIKIQETTNLVSEAREIWECLEYCKDRRLTNINIESYSMAMVQILEGTWKPPWSVALEVNHIIRLRRFVSTRVQHSLREGNALIFFANMVFDFNQSSPGYASSKMKDSTTR